MERFRTIKATELYEQSIIGHSGSRLEDQNTKENRDCGGPTHESQKETSSV